jgi:hypothetical protein
MGGPGFRKLYTLKINSYNYNDMIASIIFSCKIGKLSFFDRDIVVTTTSKHVQIMREKGQYSLVSALTILLYTPPGRSEHQTRAHD